MKHHSDLSLERSNWEGLDDSPSWLSFHLFLLAEHHPDSRLGGWLDTCLDPAEAGEREDAILLHLGCGEGCQAFEKAFAHFGLQFMLLGQFLHESTFETFTGVGLIRINGKCCGKD